MQLVKVPAPRLPGMTRATLKTTCTFAEQLASLLTGANALWRYYSTDTFKPLVNLLSIL